jgi:hypothetical protein
MTLPQVPPGDPSICAPMRASLGLSIVCCAAALAACGSSSGGSGTSPHALVVDAQNALRNARGYEFSASLVEHGQPEQFVLEADAHGNVDVSASQGGKAFQVITVGSATYINGNQAFWISAAGQRGASLAGRWFALPAAQARSLTSGLVALEPANLPRCLGENLGTLSLAGHATVGGQAAIAIANAGNAPGSAAGTLDVASTAPHYPLRLTDTHGERPGGTIDVCNNGKGTGAVGTITFSHFGGVPAVAAPANAQSLAGS